MTQAARSDPAPAAGPVPLPLRDLLTRCLAASRCSAPLSVGALTVSSISHMAARPAFLTPLDSGRRIGDDRLTKGGSGVLSGIGLSATERNFGMSIETTADRQQYVRMLLVTFVVTAVLDAIYYYGGIGGQRDDTPLRASAVAAVGGAITAALVWYSNRGAYEGGSVAVAAKRSMVLGALAAVSVLGFWIGIFGAVSVSAVLFGRKAVAGSDTRGYAGMALGVIAFLIGATLCLHGG